MKKYIQKNHTDVYPFKIGINVDNKNECSHQNIEWYNPYYFEQAKRCKDCWKRL